MDWPTAASSRWSAGAWANAIDVVSSESAQPRRIADIAGILAGAARCQLSFSGSAMSGAAEPGLIQPLLQQVTHDCAGNGGRERGFEYGFHGREHTRAPQAGLYDA